jgi:hypothetical protein
MLSNINPVNFTLDVILIIAAIWMVLTVRGLGGIIGRGLNLITIGAVILGIAHLLSTLTRALLSIDAASDAVIHRIIVLIGFVVLVAGFRQINAINR